METCARPWMPAPMMAARTARPATGGDQRLMATPDTAAVRLAVIGPASMTATGRPVRGSLTTTSPCRAGSRAAALVGKPAIHFMPTRSADPSAAGPRRYAGMAWTKLSAGRGWRPILGGSSAPVARPIIARSASRICWWSGGRQAITSAAARYRRGGVVTAEAPLRLSLLAAPSAAAGDDLSTALGPTRRGARMRGASSCSPAGLRRTCPCVGQVPGRANERRRGPARRAGPLRAAGDQKTR